MARYKRMKSGNRAITNEKKEAGEDLISSLPDHLLLHILSFLNDTKETMKTCVLSKRWALLLTELLEVDLYELGSDDEKLCRFVDFVGRMIFRCKSLNKFAVDFPYKECFASNVNLCLYFAMKNKVKDISLQFEYSSESGHELPQMLYSYSSLSKLKVRYCVMKPLRIIAWKSLESLTIGYVELLDSVMTNILSNCPVLKFLQLYHCWGLNSLNINSRNLTTLEIRNHNILDISAPYLRVLLMFKVHYFRLSNVSSVVQATIDWNILSASNTSTMNHMKQVLQSLRSVEILELGPQCLMTVSVLEVKSWKLPLFTKLQSLTLKVFRHEINIRGILAILRSSPNLRTLQILFVKGFGSSNCVKMELNQYEIRVKECNIENLKTVEINKPIGVEHMPTLVKRLMLPTASPW